MKMKMKMKRGQIEEDGEQSEVKEIEALLFYPRVEPKRLLSQRR